MSEWLRDEEIREVVGLLEVWAAGHPAPNRPFLALMGRTLTPMQFFKEVSEKTEFGASFLSFLAEQSRRFDEPATAPLLRAIEANELRTRRPDEPRTWRPS